MSCQKIGCSMLGAYQSAISINDCAILIHSTVNCNWGSLLFHTFNRNSDFRQFSTAIYENEIIFGGVEKLQYALSLMEREFSQKVIFILTGCVTELIGDNVVDAISTHESDKQIYYFSTPPNITDFFNGSIYFLENIIRLLHPLPKRMFTANIIGMFNEDIYSKANKEELQKLLSEQITILSFFPFDDWDKILSMPSAALNIVFKGYERLGELLFQTFETPYIVVSQPVGIEGTRYFIEKIFGYFDLSFPNQQFLQDEYEILDILSPFTSQIQRFHELSILIHGSSHKLSGIIHFFENELAVDKIHFIDSKEELPLDNEFDYSSIGLLLGNSFDRQFAKNRGISFLAVEFPIFDKINFTTRTYWGMRGVRYLFEDIFNELYTS